MPGDLVYLTWSTCGTIHDPANPLQAHYLWLNKGQYGMIVGGLGHPSKETRGEIEMLTFIEGKLIWVECDCLELL
jgi:hypothetical protein